MKTAESKGLKKGNRVSWRGDANDGGIITETSWDAVTIAYALWSRHQQRAHAGGSGPTVFADARADSADRGQGDPKAQAPKPIKGAQELSR